MKEIDPIFEASACIDIQFKGSLEDLAAKLSSELLIPAFSIEPDDLPPHDKIGLTEAMGWITWLKRVPGDDAFCYRLSTGTERYLLQILNGKTHNMSPWLARLVSTRCGVVARPFPPTLISPLS